MTLTGEGHRPQDLHLRVVRLVYQSRWLVELDIRAIKCTLGMEILRAKTAEMVRTELWSCPGQPRWR